MSSSLEAFRQQFDTLGPWTTRFRLRGEVFGGGYEVSEDDPLMRMFIEHLPSARRVLELGCMEGGRTFPLARRVGHVVGLDARREHLQRARYVAGFTFANATRGIAIFDVVTGDRAGAIPIDVELQEHATAVGGSLVFSPDGKEIAALWREKPVGLPFGQLLMDFSKDEDHLLRLCCWSLETGKKTADLHLPPCRLGDGVSGPAALEWLPGIGWLIGGTHVCHRDLGRLVWRFNWGRTTANSVPLEVSGSRTVWDYRIGDVVASADDLGALRVVPNGRQLMLISRCGPKDVSVGEPRGGRKKKKPGMDDGPANQPLWPMAVSVIPVPGVHIELAVGKMRSGSVAVIQPGQDIVLEMKPLPPNVPQEMREAVLRRIQGVYSTLRGAGFKVKRISDLGKTRGDEVDAIFQITTLDFDSSKVQWKVRGRDEPVWTGEITRETTPGAFSQIPYFIHRELPLLQLPGAGEPGNLRKTLDDLVSPASFVLEPQKNGAPPVSK